MFQMILKHVKNYSHILYILLIYSCTEFNIHKCKWFTQDITQVCWDTFSGSILCE